MHCHVQRCHASWDSMSLGWCKCESLGDFDNGSGYRGGTWRLVENASTHTCLSTHFTLVFPQFETVRWVASQVWCIESTAMRIPRRCSLEIWPFISLSLPRSLYRDEENFWPNRPFSCVMFRLHQKSVQNKHHAKALHNVNLYSKRTNEPWW